MKILLTNDDGIDSDGIRKLAKALRCRGHKVYVIAPDVNRSGISHAVSLLNGPVKLSACGEDTWTCTGYPADCVIVGLLGALGEKPDLVLSGINKGANIGTDIIYSGTAAAARQGGISGIPAVALSLAGINDYSTSVLKEYYWDMASSWSADHLEELMAFWERNSFVNVNIPNNPKGPEGIARARPAIKKYNDAITLLDAPDGNRWCFIKAGEESAESGTDNDWNTVSRNLVSVSLLHCYAVVYEGKKD